MNSEGNKNINNKSILTWNIAYVDYSIYTHITSMFHNGFNEIVKV